MLNVERYCIRICICFSATNNLARSFIIFIYFIFYRLNLRRLCRHNFHNRRKNSKHNWGIIGRLDGIIIGCTVRSRYVALHV